MIKYVVGFMFNFDKSKVVLIRKNRPDWQKGFLNGIGGKNNENEHPLDAMCREFEEETGYKTYYYHWHLIATLTNPHNSYEVDVFYCDSAMNSFDKLKSVTDEQLEVINVDNIDNEKVNSNLPWLIRMCLDSQFISAKIICK